MKISQSQEKAIVSALIKRATGYEVHEVAEEFSIKPETKEEVLSKRKVSSHYCAPDISAIKILLSACNLLPVNELENMTDEELIKERDELLEQLKKRSKNGKKENN